MGTKRYGQACGLARSLDVLGERWTLLVIRELLLGPKRYSDLAARLPGIPTNVLGERLKHLVSHGIAEKRVLPPPAPATVYALTETGHGLTPAVLALMAWGTALPWTTEEADGVQVSAAWDALTMVAANPLERAPDQPDITVALHSAGEAVALSVRGLVLQVQDGDPQRPDATLSVEPRVFRQLRLGTLDLDEALADDRASITGDTDAVRELFRLGRSRQAVPTP